MYHTKISKCPHCGQRTLKEMGKECSEDEKILGYICSEGCGSEFGIEYKNDFETGKQQIYLKRKITNYTELVLQGVLDEDKLYTDKYLIKEIDFI